jgi:zinc transport system substrate-binding protein
MMKKFFCGFLAALLLGLSLVGCAETGEKARVSVVCTVFPLYDWTRRVVGDVEGVEVIWLSDQGTDLHSFQPSAEDVMRIASADLTVFVGGVSDGWVREALRQSSGEALALSEWEGVTLRCVSDESGHGHEDGHDHETDEHIWLSLKNAAVSVEAIRQALGEIDGEHAEEYGENAETYLAELRELDGRYAETVAEAAEPRLLFADRFPFVYLTEDYGVDYVAAFSGCTTDVDADFSTVVRLSETADRWETEYVMVTENSDGALAEGVIRASSNPHRRVARMNSLQSVRRADAEGGVTYLSVMEENLTVLRRVWEIESKE